MRCPHVVSWRFVWLVASICCTLLIPPETAAATANKPVPGSGSEAADTTQGYLEQLQLDDARFYPEDLLEIDFALRDSALAALDSLGFEAYQQRARSRSRVFDFDLNPAGRLMTYNRVEGLVAGLAADFSWSRWSLDLQGAYATGPEKLRFLGALGAILAWGRLYGEVGYAERVVAYGSNRPTANSLRTLVGSADERDYLKSEGGWVWLRVPWRGGGNLGLGYEAKKESSVQAATTFAFLGNSARMGSNAAIESGYDRAVFLRGNLGSLEEDRREVSFEYRIAGGGLGGDFIYTRVDAGASARRYLLADHELVITAGFSRVGGSPSLQQVPDVGGLSTVRGFSRRTLLGKSAISARVELLVPYDFLAWTTVPVIRDLRLQFVPWADGGRVWDGNRNTWITSAGAGVQRYLGPFGKGAYLRLDAAFPTGPDRPDEIRWYLRFSRALF